MGPGEGGRVVMGRGGGGQRLIMTPVGQVMITHQPPTASQLPSAWLTCLSLLSTLTPVTPKSERTLELQLTVRAFLPLREPVWPSGKAVGW